MKKKEVVERLSRAAKIIRDDRRKWCRGATFGNSGKRCAVGWCFPEANRIHAINSLDFSDLIFWSRRYSNNIFGKIVEAVNDTASSAREVADKLDMIASAILSDCEGD